MVKVSSLALSALLLLPYVPFGQARADAATGQTVYDVTVSTQDQQTVKGWGVFPAWNRSDWNHNFIDKTGAQQALFNDLGASMFRTMIPPGAGDGDGNLIDDKMQEVYDLIHAGETRGMHDYIISVWSPPVDMKTIPTVNGWTGTEHVRLRPDKEDAYTTYLVNAIEWLSAHGASVPKALSFQNEPLSQIISEWCYWGGDNGAQYQRVAKLLRTKLDAAGLTDVQIIAPEGASYHENELLLGDDFSALANDPALDDAIGGIASHSYYAKGYDNTSVYENYVDALNHVPDKDRWQTEYSSLISGISEMDMAINTAQRLSGDMAFIQNNYWFWWLGWSDGRHPTDVGEVLLDGDGYTVTKSKAYYVLSNVFNNVPVGSKVRRLTADPASGLTTDDAVWMDGVAFENGSKTVVLLVNSTDQAKTVNVKGLSGAAANVYQLTNDVPLGQDMTLAAARSIQQGTAPDIALPAKSVSVIVTSDTDTAPPYIRFDQSDSSSTMDASYAVRNPAFTVSGHLDKAGSLSIDGQPVPVAEDLSFSTTVTLHSGMNTITAVTADDQGHEGNPASLHIRYDPSYLGLSLDQSNPSYVQASAFGVSGMTNGGATVEVRQQFGGETVADNTYTVGTPGSGDGGSGGSAGELIRSIAADGWSGSAGVLGPSAGGLSVNSGNVWDPATTFTPAEGAKSLRMKLNPGFARLNIDFLDGAYHGTTEDLTAYQNTGALQFWVYTKRMEDSLSAVVESNDNGTKVEARLPLRNVLSASDYGNQWVKVTIPLSDFDAAQHDDPATNEPVSAPIDWSHASGIGFASQTSAYYDPYVDDLKLVYTTQPDTSTGPFTFDADLQLLKGDNTITVTAANGTGQQAAPVVLHAVYDPDPPVLTVPAEGSATTTSYVLKGSVDEAAEVTVNGTEVSLQSDHTFTAIVPVVAGSNTLTVIARDPAGNESQAVVLVDCEPVEDGALAPSVAAANEAAAAPTIDGDLSESGWNVNTQVRQPVIGVSDNVVSFGTMWDDSNLYVAVKVLDADLKNDSDPSVTYQDDSVEIYVDGDNARSASYGADDHQITLGWHDQALSVGGDIPGIRYAQQDIDGGYTVEMAIPWSGIGIAPPQAGSVIGFDVGNNDDDGHNSGDRESQVLWSGNNDNWRSTSAFGSLYLDDDRNVAVSLEHTGAITVDGALSESDWALGSSVAKPISGVSNNAVRFGSLNDSQNLYVGIEVLDATLKNDSDLAYQDDSVEVYLDADNSQGASYDSNDHQITLGWHDGQLAMIGNVEGVQFAQQDIDGGYTVEMAIPWSSLGVTPARDITLGFDVGNNDDDGQNSGDRESQIMWNGGANNWQDTSAFGHLLVHNLSLPLPESNEPEPEGLTEFTDDNSTLSNVFAKTDHIAVQTSHPENFDNDAASFIHTNDNPTSPESVVYQSPDGDIYSFDIATGLYSNTPQFVFYGSADGVNFTRISAQAKTIGGANGYGVFSNTASNLPAGTKYLKIEFPGKLNWNERLLNVSYKYFGQQTDPDQATFTDDAADLSKLYGQSANIVSVNDDNSLDKYGGDATRLVHRNDDSLEPEYVVYQSPAGDIHSFDINASAWVGLPSTVGFEVYGSTDGTNYAALPASQTMLSSSSGFNTLGIKADGLASGYRYLKIVFPYGTADCDNWTATINKVTFAYHAESDAPTLASVALAAEPAADMLPVGGTAALTVTGLLSDGTPADLGQARIDYASDNGQVATVDEGGTVSAAAEGTANVTAAVTMGGVTRTASLAFAVDGTPPTFSLSAGGEPLVEGASFEDTAQLAFHAGDSLSGLSSASVSIDGRIYALDPQDEGGLTVDLAGQVGSHTATVAVEDTAGNRLEQTIAFTVTTSIDAMKLLLERYGTADTKQVLGNHLDQAQHQLDKGKPDHAAKHMQDFLKHLNNEALAGGIDATGQSALTADADALIVRWTN